MEKSLSKVSRSQKVRSAEVGSTVLKALADLAPSTSLSRLAAHVGMPASKVHRYLQALVDSGFAEQDSNSNHYYLGREALRVGLAALGRLDVIKVSASRLTALREHLNETCFLAVWGNRGPTVVMLEQASKSVTLVTQIGSVLPLLRSSTGLVFDAFLPESSKADLLNDELAGATAETAEAIEQQRQQIRERGLHSVHGLFMPGVDAISAPLFAIGNQVAAVITVLGTTGTLDVSYGGAIAGALQQTTRTISLQMGAPS